MYILFKTMKLFKNKPNIQHITHDGREIWESRSVAIVPIIMAYSNDGIHILAQKRSKLMDFPEMWTLPCGYLDWDETGWDAVRREVFEETSFLIDKHIDKLKRSNNRKPIDVNTNIDENLQNVALIYKLCFYFDKLPLYVEKHKTSETLEVKWIKLKDIHNYEWAFNHDKLIFKSL